jgi:NADH-quinone oxidoreductase subunit C
MDDCGSSALARLIEVLPDAVLNTHARLGQPTALVEADRVTEVLALAREDEALGFDMLTDLTAVDYLDRSPRFEVVYHLYSTGGRHRLRVKAGVAEEPCEIDSAVGVWPAANWMEREVWDMYGISFRGHPDLRRILLYDAFEGHPLRKDYPKRKRQPIFAPRT